MSKPTHSCLQEMAIEGRHTSFASLMTSSAAARQLQESDPPAKEDGAPGRINDSAL